jgi:acyl-coenzyme A synthetase/AMP-(fatty) acid ligase
VPVFGTGEGERETLKFSIDLDKEIQSHSKSTPIEQEETGYLDEMFYLYTSGTAQLASLKPQL